MKFKTLAILHFTGIALVVLRLCLIPLDDHLRFGIGHVVCWLVVVSAVFAFFYVPKGMSSRRWMKAYFGIYFFNTCFMALYPLAMVVLFAIAACVPGGWRLTVWEDCFVQALIPKPVECENSAYIIRKWNDVEYTDGNERFYLYRKEAFAERLITTRHAGGSDHETYHARRILDVDKDKGILKVKVDVGSFAAAHDSIRSEIQEWNIKESAIE